MLEPAEARSNELALAQTAGSSAQQWRRQAVVVWSVHESGLLLLLIAARATTVNTVASTPISTRKKNRPLNTRAPLDAMSQTRPITTISAPTAAGGNDSECLCSVRRDSLAWDRSSARGCLRRVVRMQPVETCNPRPGREREGRQRHFADLLPLLAALVPVGMLFLIVCLASPPLGLARSPFGFLLVPSGLMSVPPAAGLYPTRCSPQP